jgi:hypothetical protein
MVRVKTKTSEVKELRPKDLLGLKGHGGEPGIPENFDKISRESFVGRCFNWYNYFCSNKEAKQFMIDYLTHTHQSNEAKKLNRVPDSKIRATYGWLARLSLRGLVLTKDEQSKFTSEVKKLIADDAKNNYDDDADIVEIETNKRNVQQVMKERASDVSGEIQGFLDHYIEEGCKSNIDISTKIVNLLSEKNILPQHISIVSLPWNTLKTELQDVVTGEDKQLTEGYSHLSKQQIKNLIKFVDQVLSNIGSYTNLKQTTKAKRKRKPVSVEKQVSKLKYLRKFVDEKAKLNLVSIEPTKLHNSSECYLYDTVKRKLIYVCADDLGKYLIVKGTTLLGFDTSKSQVKTIRKPGEQINAFMKVGKPASRKLFNDINAVGTKFNGRTNVNIVILKVW